jgi:hypothetical protein
MRSFPTVETLVATYWRKLARSNGAIHRSRSHVNAKRIARALRSRLAQRGGYSTGAARPDPFELMACGLFV